MKLAALVCLAVLTSGTIAAAPVSAADDDQIPLGTMDDLGAPELTAESSAPAKKNSAVLACVQESSSTEKKRKKKAVVPEKKPSSCLAVKSLAKKDRGGWSFRKARWQRWTRKTAMGHATFYLKEKRLGRLKLRAFEPKKKRYRGEGKRMTFTRIEVNHKGSWKPLKRLMRGRSGVLPNPTKTLKIPTYDGSGQATHPDVVRVPKRWNGYRYWMAMTPYPHTNDQFENPSILASNNSRRWVVPSGLSNPLAPAPECDHNSDTDLVYNRATNEMFVYYLRTQRADRCVGHESAAYFNRNYVMMQRSSDGVNWSAPVKVLEWDLATSPVYLSPAVVKVGSKFTMWLTDGAGGVVRYHSYDGVSWAYEGLTNVAYNAWHLDVLYVPSKKQYWMLSDYPRVGGSLRWSTSRNGVSWKGFKKPVLTPPLAGWDVNPYRGTMTYDKKTDLLRLWYSGYRRPGNVAKAIWNIGEEKVEYKQFLRMLKGRRVK